MLLVDDPGLVDNLARLSLRLNDPEERWHLLQHPVDALHQISDCVIDLFSRWYETVAMIILSCWHPTGSFLSHTSWLQGKPNRAWLTTGRRLHRGGGGGCPRGAQRLRRHQVGVQTAPSAAAAPEPGGPGALCGRTSSCL